LLQFLREQVALLDCSTSAQVADLEFDAVSGFIKTSSDAEAGKFVFTYNMRFTNRGTRRLRILSHTYDFCDANEEVVSQIRPGHPEAAGVAGVTPLLEPGASFVFGSGVVMPTRMGSVRGQFLIMEEPNLRGEDAKMHLEMERAELMVRFLYLKGLGTKLFQLPFNCLRFNTDVGCICLRRKGDALPV